MGGQYERHEVQVFESQFSSRISTLWIRPADRAEPLYLEHNALLRTVPTEFGLLADLGKSGGPNCIHRLYLAKQCFPFWLESYLNRFVLFKIERKHVCLPTLLPEQCQVWSVHWKNKELEELEVDCVNELVCQCRTQCKWERHQINDWDMTRNASTASRIILEISETGTEPSTNYKHIAMLLVDAIG